MIEDLLLQLQYSCVQIPELCKECSIALQVSQAEGIKTLQAAGSDARGMTR